MGEDIAIRWGEAISQAVREEQAMRKELEGLGYKFEGAGDGTLAYKVIYPDGRVVIANYENSLRKILEEARGNYRR